MRREKSEAIFRQAKNLIPGGVNSPARAFGAVGGNPVVIDRAQGPYLYDVDGNRYIDYVLSWGPMILGHTSPAVTQALSEAIQRGTSYGAPTENENRLAELVRTMIPSIEKIRLVNSGTEATMSAVRLARGYTGRNKILKFIGCYHGHVDSLLVAAGSAGATLGVPNSPGVTPGAVADTILLDYNSVAEVLDVFEESGDEIAAAIVEPVAGNMGCVPQQHDFLLALRDCCREHGSLLIFDEVMTGFRVARGGAQECFPEITPDLTTLGKIIGGGLPVGAYGGRAEIMDHVLPEGKVFQAGTLSGNPLATAAGIATLTAIQNDPDFYVRLASATERLARGLEQAAADARIHAVAQNIGGMMTLFFPAPDVQLVYNWPTASRCDTKLFAQYFWGMLDRGVYLPCSQYESMFTSSVHTPEIIDQTIQIAREVFQEIGRANN